MKYLLILLLGSIFSFTNNNTNKRTIVSIRNGQFFINNEITYKNKYWQGYKVEGLLFNSRMVQGIFDDLNPETRELWKYPDTKKWDPDRNTDEFVAAMSEWRRHGLLAFTLNIQGGSPTGYGNKAWMNPGFHPDGKLMDDYFKRLERIMDKADQLGMVVILGIFYFGQDQYLKDEAAVKNAVNNTVDWIFQKGYRNVMIEIDNECDSKSYDHAILKPERVHELIEMVKNKRHPQKGYSLYASVSYQGHRIPGDKVVEASDFILLHGNGVEHPEDITKMVAAVRSLPTYTSKPILFNEDDHYDFDKPENNMVNAIKANASWGFFDFRKRGETLRENDASFDEGYQSIPVNWKISSERKKQFFEKLKEITSQVNNQSGDFWKSITKKHHIKYDAYTIHNNYFIVGTKEIIDNREIFKNVIVISNGSESYWIFKSKTASYDPQTTILEINDCTMEKFKKAPKLVKPENSYKHINYSVNFEKNIASMSDVGQN